MPDYSNQNLAVTQAWERQEAAREAASQRAEEEREAMRYTPHALRLLDDAVYCERCGVHRDHHGQDFPR